MAAFTAARLPDPLLACACLVPGGAQLSEFIRHDVGCATRRRRANVLAIVIHRLEVSPMNAVSAVGAPLQSTIARLR